MFSLLSGLWQYFFSKPNLHVLLIGLDHAGKTTVLERIKSKYGNSPGIPLDRIPPTVGMNLAKINVRGVQVILWDLGGQIKMRSIWEKYYSEANAVVFVVDSADVERLEEAKLAYDSACDNDGLKKVPVITLANKQDLVGALSPMDLGMTFTCLDPTDRFTRVFSVSAVTGQGLEEAVSCVVDEALRNARLKER